MRGLRRVFPVLFPIVLLLLFAVPWWTIVGSDSWPTPAFVAGTVVFAVALVGFPLAMRQGHRSGGSDLAARIGDTTLGVIWVMFTWSVLGLVVRLVLKLSGVDDPLRCRITALGALVIAAVLVLFGNIEAMRVPRIRAVEVVIPRLGKGLDGLRVVVLADTHYGPINRTGWSKGVVAAVNTLEADVVCHAGDLADGTVAQRREQVDPLGEVNAGSAKLYITGNHEYFSEAQDWLDHMGSLGWQPLHNRHHLVERGGDRLIFAGVDDRTAASSGLAGHGTNLAVSSARPVGTGLPARTPTGHRAHPALHQPGRRFLGTAAAGVRAERNLPADPARRLNHLRPVSRRNHADPVRGRPSGRSR